MFILCDKGIHVVAACWLLINSLGSYKTRFEVTAFFKEEREFKLMKYCTVD